MKIQLGDAHHVGSDEEQTHHLKAKEAELHIRRLVDEIVKSNDDQTAIGALDMIHKLLSK